LPIDKKGTNRVRGRSLYAIGKRAATALACFRFYANRIFGLLLCCANEEISPRFPIALPILYTSSKAISVGIKPTATNMPASPKFIA
jgi:hypothetical protein